MATVGLEKLLPEVMPDLPGCSRGLILRNLNHALIEFCDESLFQHEDFTPIPVIAGTAEYAITVSAGHVVALPVHIAYDGTALYPKTKRAMDIENPSWRAVTATHPVYYLMSSTSTIRLYPTPDAPGQITGEVAIKPDRDNRVMLDDIYNDHAETIAAGALGRLMGMKGNEWFNAAMAGHFLSVFQAGVTDAKVARMKGFTDADLTINPVTIGV